MLFDDAAVDLFEIVFHFPEIAHQLIAESGEEFESFLYLIRNGALDWGPVVRARRSALRSMPARTTTSTIRRVGTEGRAAGTEVAA